MFEVSVAAQLGLTEPWRVMGTSDCSAACLGGCTLMWARTSRQCAACCAKSTAPNVATADKNATTDSSVERACMTTGVKLAAPGSESTRGSTRGGCGG